MQMEKKDIRSVSKEQLRDFFVAHGEKAFRGNQVYEWLWSKGAHHFDDMTNVSKETRTMLQNHFVINHIKVDTMQRSEDGTVKNAVRLHDGLVVESVLIPTKTRTTACVSSQVGCSLDCNFCATARLNPSKVKVSELGSFSGPVKMPSVVLNELMMIIKIGPIAIIAKNSNDKWTTRFFDLI
jgi:adenine C2-methylase RlmN of 23S rRNA A2503 and tRNA A37